MGLDIKIPIGLMFLVLGIILTIFGFATNGETEMYAKSLNHNINLWSGIFMVIFALFMLFTSALFRKKNRQA